MADGQKGTDAERPVELAYRPTADDIAAALRVRAKSTRSGRLLRRLMLFSVAAAAVGALLSMAGSRRHDAPWHLYVGLVAFAVVMTVIPRLQARQLHRLSERQGDARVSVDDTGVRVTTAHSSVAIDWHLYPRYRIASPASSRTTRRFRPSC